MKKIFVAVFLIISTLVLAQTKDIQRRGVLNLCTSPDYEPFEFKDVHDAYLGFDIAMVKLFADSIGVRLNIIDTDWDDLFPALQNGSCDIVASGLTINSYRKEIADFSKPYFANGLVLLVNNKHKGKVTSFRDVNQEFITVTTQSGTSAADMLDTFFKKAIKNYSPDVAVAAGMVVDGKADVFVYDYTYIHAIYDDNVARNTFIIAVPFTYEPFGFAVKKGNTELVQSLDRFIDEVEEDGRYERLVNYWILSSDWQNDYEL